MSIPKRKNRGWRWWGGDVFQYLTYMFSSPTMQRAESIFTVSVIMCGCFGSIALDNSKRLLSSPRILCNPYLKKQKAYSEKTVFALNTHNHLWASDP